MAPYSRVKDRWVGACIVAACMVPLIILAGYIYVGIHFLMKFW